MPMNEYGEIIRNSSPPPPIPPVNNNSNHNNQGGGGGSVVAVVVGIIILVLVIWFISTNVNNQGSKSSDNSYNSNQVDSDYDNGNADSDYSNDDSYAADDSYDTDDDVVDDSYEDTSEYILPNSSSEYIDEDDLQGLSKDEVQLARNEIYARHGRKFKTDWIMSYFEDQTWYDPIYDPDDFPESLLNTYEKANVNTIVQYEKDKGWK